MEKKKKERAGGKSPVQPIRFQLTLADRKDREASLVSIQKMDEQSDRLGILDPTDAEPAILYFPEPQFFTFPRNPKDERPRSP